MTPRHLLEPARLAGHALLRAQPDERLIDLVRAGNEGAFEALVQRYRRPLGRYCRRLLGQGRDDDALQQVFLKAYDAIHAGAGAFALRPWLFRVAHNVSLNLLRERACSYEELPDGLGGAESADEALAHGERLRAVLAAVHTLPPSQRDAIVLRELEGRSHAEIAAKLGVSQGAARQLIKRARDSVRAAAAALTPLPLLTRLADANASPASAARVTELAAAGGLSATAAKLGAVVAVTAAVAGGVPAARGLAGSGSESNAASGSLAASRNSTGADPKLHSPARGRGGDGTDERRDGRGQRPEDDHDERGSGRNHDRDRGEHDGDRGEDDREGDEREAEDDRDRREPDESEAAPEREAEEDDVEEESDVDEDDEQAETEPDEPESGLHDDRAERLQIREQEE